MLDGVLQSLKTMLHSALIKAISLAGITVGSEKSLVGLQYVYCFFGRFVHCDQHKRRYEESTIG